MWFPKAVIHAVYACCYLARQGPSNPVSATAVAESMGVPPAQAAKVLQGLATAGVAASQRGRQGGYMLARPLETISIAELFNALASPDDPERLGPRVCPLSGTERCFPPPCVAHEGLLRLHDRVRETLAHESLFRLTDSSCQEQSEVGSWPGRAP
jgi:Rrf2 family protein